MRTRKLPCGRKVPGGVLTPEKIRERCRAKLRRYVSEQKLNRSESRNRIFEVLLDQKGHFRALDLVTRVRAKHTSISQATIYRNLALFLKAELVRESYLDEDAQILYELHHSSHHDHILCVDCGEVIEFHETGIERLQDKLLGEMKFVQNRHAHVIYASCEMQKRN